MELSVIDENNVNLLWEFPTKINKVLREKLAADKSTEINFTFSRAEKSDIM